MYKFNYNICPDINHEECTHNLLQCTKCGENHYSRDCEMLKHDHRQIVCLRCYHYGGYTSMCYCENKL